MVCEICRGEGVVWTCEKEDGRRILDPVTDHCPRPTSRRCPHPACLDGVVERSDGRIRGIQQIGLTE